MQHDLSQVMEAVLKEVFEDLPRLDTNWTEKPVSALCYPPQYGYTQSATPEPVGPKFLRITDIQESGVNWESVPYCHISEKQLAAFQLQKGDILFARSGATTGKTFLVQECPLAVFASYLIRLRVRGDILPELLGWFFKSNAYWSQVRPRGGAQPNMNATLLSRVKVHYPKSLHAQQQIVNYLNSIQAEVNNMQATLRYDEELLQQVEQAILNEAFRGEL
jgi:type I restriction enzyme S subunit